MHHSFKLLFVLLSVAFPVAAARGADNTDAGRVAAALQAWEKAKQACGGNYSYRISKSSFSGLSQTTIVKVQNNEVVARTFEKFNARQLLGPGIPKKERWQETGDAIGSHKEGAPAKTLDEIYAGAAKIAAAPLKKFENRYIRTNKAGLLTSCFYVDTRIADDAPLTGFMISEIKTVDQQ